MQPNTSLERTADAVSARRRGEVGVQVYWPPAEGPMTLVSATASPYFQQEAEAITSWLRRLDSSVGGQDCPPTKALFAISFWRV